MALGDAVAAILVDPKRAVGGLFRVRVHRLVGEEERPRLRVLPRDELHRHRVHDVGDVAPVLEVRPVVTQPGVDQAPVPVVGHPVVVARARHAVVAHVPLPDMRGFVSEPLQLEVVVRQAVAGRVARHVVDDAVPARILSGEDRRPVGRADRRGVKRPVEQGPFARDAVHVRGFHVRVPARAELVVAQVVDQDDEEVGLPLHPHTGSVRPQTTARTVAPFCVVTV